MGRRMPSDEDSRNLDFYLQLKEREEFDSVKPDTYSYGRKDYLRIATCEYWFKVDDDRTFGMGIGERRSTQTI